MSCLTLEMAQLAVTALGLEVLDASLDILLAPGEHGVDEAGELVRGCLDRSRRAQLLYRTLSRQVFSNYTDRISHNASPSSGVVSRGRHRVKPLRGSSASLRPYG